MSTPEQPVSTRNNHLSSSKANYCMRQLLITLFLLAGCTVSTYAAAPTPSPSSSELCFETEKEISDWMKRTAFGGGMCYSFAVRGRRVVVADLMHTSGIVSSHAYMFIDEYDPFCLIVDVIFMNLHDRLYPLVIIGSSNSYVIKRKRFKFVAELPFIASWRVFYIRNDILHIMESHVH